MAKNTTKGSKIEITNRRASFEYHFVQEYEAGIALTGTEIKSIRAGNVNINDAYCIFEGGELWIRNMYVAEYEYGTDNNHEPRRTRKLLLRKAELRKLDRRVREKGFTIIPFQLFLTDRGFVKLRVELATGKKTYDKRETIKQRDDKRQLDRIKKIIRNR
ncbi:MAG: SsrA-binding protein SmpB [Saprospirales bacterium]|jgi:SsrA-binding protein|nr:SsrA-binding protein SmpB [Saprospirales bacterium]